MSWPRHVALGRWLGGPSNVRTQALRAVERRGVAHHLPLALLVREPIADLDVHRQHRDGRRVAALGRRRLRAPRVRLPTLAAHSIT